jgi:hypothetical protein
MFDVFKLFIIKIASIIELLIPFWTSTFSREGIGSGRKDESLATPREQRSSLSGIRCSLC